MRHGRIAFAATLIAALATTLGATPAAGQGWIDPIARTADWGVVKLSTDVTVRVEGRIAEVVVEEWFENRGGGLGEGDYLYPLPGEAVFSNFSLYQGDQELRGETMNAERARAIYEEIVRQKRDPALIELVGHGLVRARVFPIEPGQRRRITLRYTQVLERTGESVQFRYAAGTRSGGAGPGRTGARTGAGVPVDLNLIAKASPYGEPFSPTHALDVERREDTLRVRAVSELTGNLSVFLPIANDHVGITLATHRSAGEAGYFMLTLSPGRVDRGGTPRDITAVVDVSGSMSGAKIEQTRAALHQLLASLGPEDRFRLVAFSNRVRSSGDGWSEASTAELRKARRWIDGLRADGGTNIAGAMDEALRLPSPDDRLPIVVFLTDGLPTVGEQNPERIAEAAESGRGRARIFAFGVGYDVNTYLLDRLGVAGRGSTAYVEPGDDVERAVSALASKITHPVLTDLRIEGAPVTLAEIYPGELPDLFAGEDLVVFGRYEGAGDGRLRISGRRGGRTERHAADAAFPRQAAANDYIPRLWASRKLGELTRQIRLNGRDPELVESVRQTALRYGLLSEYTSYLVQEPGMVADGRPLPTPRPERLAAEPARTGEAAVKASQRTQAMRAVASAADLAVAEREESGGARRKDVRLVGGRTFRLDGGVWMEAYSGEDSDRETFPIAPFSDAYFAVLRALPELRPVVQELTAVTIRGEAALIAFHDDGERSLSERELERLVAMFRRR